MTRLTTDQHQVDGSDGEHRELNPEEQERADEILEGYQEDHRPTVVLPGSHGTISGTAVSEWVDENGDPKYGDSAESDHRGDD